MPRGKKDGSPKPPNVEKAARKLAVALSPFTKDERKLVVRTALAMLKLAAKLSA